MSNDPNAPLVELVWYVTRLPFQAGESVINSSDWDEEPWAPRVVGEIFGAPRTYNGRWEVIGLTGNHQCGTPAEFAEGSPWPYDGPAVLYDEDNIPLCCGRIIGKLRAGARLAAPIAQHFRPTAHVIAGARLAATMFFRHHPPAHLIAGARLAAPVAHHMVVGAHLDAGASLAAPVSVYCNQYSTTEAGNLHTFIRNPAVPSDFDERWIGSPAVDGAWALVSPHGTGTPGLWRCVRLTVPGRTYQTGSPWDGRGSFTFTRTSSPFNSITVTCDD